MHACMARQRVTRHSLEQSLWGLGSSCFVVTGCGNRWAFAFLDSHLLHGSPSRPRIVTAGAEGAWAPRAPGPCRVPRLYTPYTSLLPCNTPACLDSPVPLKHRTTHVHRHCPSKALARCSCWSNQAFTFSRESCAHVPKPSTNPCALIFIFLLALSPFCGFPVLCACYICPRTMPPLSAQS